MCTFLFCVCLRVRARCCMTVKLKLLLFSYCDVRVVSVLYSVRALCVVCVFAFKQVLSCFVSYVVVWLL